MQDDFVDPVDKDQPMVARAPFSCAIVSTTELIDLHPGGEQARWFRCIVIFAVYIAIMSHLGRRVFAPPRWHNATQSMRRSDKNAFLVV